MIQKYLSFDTESEAVTKDADNLRVREDARAVTARENSKWKPSGKTRDDVDYPAGVWPGSVYGLGRVPDPTLGIATASDLVRRNTIDRKYYVRDDSGVEVDDSKFDPLSGTAHRSISLTAI